jgi:hypothetical protein
LACFAAPGLSADGLAKIAYELKMRFWAEVGQATPPPKDLEALPL